MTTSGNDRHGGTRDDGLAPVTDLSAWRSSASQTRANAAPPEEGTGATAPEAEPAAPMSAKADVTAAETPEAGPFAQAESDDAASAGVGIEGDTVERDDSTMTSPGAPHVPSDGDEPQPRAAPGVAPVFGAGDSRRGSGTGPSVDSAKRFTARRLEHRRQEAAAAAAAAEPQPGLRRVPYPTRGDRAAGADGAAARGAAVSRRAASDAAAAASAGGDAGDTTGAKAQATAEAIEAAEQRMLRRLRRADRSREELRRELASDELLDAAAIECLLDRLTDLGYIDDVRMAETLADKLFDRKGKGLEGVRRELRHRLLDDSVITAALEGRERDDEFGRAASLAASRAERLRGLDRDTAMRRLTGFLQRRGFGSGVALIAANEALDALDRPGSPERGRGNTRPDVSGVYFANTDE